MYKNILIPVDMSHSDRAEPMIEAAGKLGGGNAEITLITIIEDAPSYVMVQLPEDVLEEETANARQALEALAAKAGVAANVEIGRGRAHSAILAHAERGGADLIIVASHKPGMQDFLLGSTAARVVRHAGCSVFVLR